MTSPLRTLISAAHRVVCATRGHDRLLQIEPHRLSLRCLRCGHETSGWTIGEPVFFDNAAVSAPRRRVRASHAV